MALRKRAVDLIYIEGTGDVVEALTRWYKQEDLLTETSKTFSGQLFDFCKKNDLNTLAISAFSQTKQVSFDGFSAYSKPKLEIKGSIGYHLSQVLYGFKIIFIALRHRPHYLHMTNGATHWFMLAPLKLLGIKIFPQFHNTFWAKGYPQTGKIQRLLLNLDAWFLKHIATGAFCCSPEIQNQIAEITHGRSCPTYWFKAQFNRNSFTPPPAPKPYDVKPFTVVFAGRVERNKGVFDILKIAESLKNDDVIFHICGDGTDLEALRLECKQLALETKVVTHGKLKRPELLSIYSQGHIVIVPTRSEFCEGLPMVAIEAVLLGRPVVTSSLSNALDVLGPAIFEAQPEDIDSYVNAIRQLITNKQLFQEKQTACFELREQFLDNKEGLAKVLDNSLNLS